MKTKPHKILSQNAFIDARSTEVYAETRTLLARRKRNFGASSVLFYRTPLHIVRAEGIWMIAADGRRYLDAYNNVPSIGHSHPRVVEAIAAQATKISVSTRYLQDVIEQYAERLKATLPKALSNLVLTCTGSEANDLAMRIARSATGGRGFVVTETAYHGNTTAVTEISPAVFTRAGTPRHVRLVAPPSRAAHGEDIAGGFAAAVGAAIASLERARIPFAGLICDSIFSSDGVYADPPGFIKKAVKTARAAGGLFIADEVQPGFARTGDHMWGFGRHGVTPDIVTLGKPMGNGYPMAGLAVRPKQLTAFCDDVGYFNTFGGNPVAAAAGLAVLDVIAEEGMQENARLIGAALRDRLAALASRFPIIAEVRGAGLFIGVELRNPDDPTRLDSDTATRICNGMRDQGVLIGSAGRYGNVLKIRPPLCMKIEHVDFLIDALEKTLGE
ncbi:MAG: aspartate aminotransferase family protein [Proteobacteria bacterium]|nr:aspartate aminotransferase family protein [Pseudomonadota bacterium]MDA1357510.1 aspartate aminotransferase family protein [Pseudomonadota bacterium]